MKNLSNLKGAQKLNIIEQKSINGGKATPERCENQNCPPGYCCGSDLYNCVLAGSNGQNCK